MAEYRKGQTIKAEYDDGTSIVARLEYGVSANTLVACFGGYVHEFQKPRGMAGGNPYYVTGRWAKARITVLSEPRPEEPKGLGAVVEASTNDRADRRPWVRLPNVVAERTRVWHDGSYVVAWIELIDPVLFDGWEPKCNCACPGRIFHAASCPLSEERAE